MAVLQFRERRARRSGSATGVEFTDNRVFLIKTDSMVESSASLYAYGVTPRYLDPISPAFPYLTMRKFSYTQPASLWYEITCEYSSGPISQEDHNRAIANPLSRPALTRWDKRKETVPADRDIDGQPKVNTAGEAFDPPPEKTETIWIYRVVKNLPLPPTWLADYEDSVNDQTMRIYERDGTPIYTILRGGAKLVIDDLGDLHEENGVEFYQFKFSLELKLRPDIYVGSGGKMNTRNGQSPTAEVIPEAWQTVGLNHGLKEIKSGVLTNMTDDDGSTLTAPYPLTETGAKVTGSNVAARRNAVIFLVWDDLKHKDFSVLPMI